MRQFSTLSKIGVYTCMSSTHLLKISERSRHVNWFNFGFKVASNKTIFSTLYYTLAVYPTYALVTSAV